MTARESCGVGDHFDRKTGAFRSSCAQVSRAATSQVTGDCPVSVANASPRFAPTGCRRSWTPLVPGTLGQIGRLRCSGRGYPDRMTTAAQLEASQRVRFCRSSDGVRIAYAVHGHRPPVVLDACWLSHLGSSTGAVRCGGTISWRARAVATVIPLRRARPRALGSEVSDFSLRRRVDDLAAVVDDAGLDRFALIAMAQGGPVSLHYLHEHPGRVTRFVCASTSREPGST